ncbi:unnamed protein product [Urochloa humidicola]
MDDVMDHRGAAGNEIEKQEPETRARARGHGVWPCGGLAWGGARPWCGGLLRIAKALPYTLCGVLRIRCFTFIFSVARDVLPRKYGRLVPLPMAMAVPFLVGGNFAIDMCVGSLIVFVWNKMNKKEAAFMVPAVASGLICGDGIWTFPSSLLALAKIKLPICMKFTPGS